MKSLTSIQWSWCEFICLFILLVAVYCSCLVSVVLGVGIVLFSQNERLSAYRTEREEYYAEHK